MTRRRFEAIIAVGALRYGDGHASILIEAPDEILDMIDNSDLRDDGWTHVPTEPGVYQVVAEYVLKEFSFMDEFSGDVEFRIIESRNLPINK